MGAISGKNGYMYIPLRSSGYTYNGGSWEVRWHEDVDIEQNQSVVSIDGIRLDLNISTDIYWLDGTITFTGSDGRSTTFMATSYGSREFKINSKFGSTSIQSANNIVVSWPACRVEHRADGTADFTMTFNVYGKSANTGATFGMNGTARSATKPLTTIPHSSDIVCINADVGSYGKIQINRKSPDQVVKLEYRYKDQSSYTLVSNSVSGSYIDWKIPMDAYNHMPYNQNNVEIEFKATTYTPSGSLVGDAVAVMTGYATQADAAPDCRLNYNILNDASAVTGQKNDYICNHTNVTLTGVVTLKYGAKLVSQRLINGDDVRNTNTATYYGSPIYEFYYEVLDSRGFKSKAKAYFNQIIQYTKPTLIIKEARIDSFGNLIISTNSKFFNGYIGNRLNRASLYYRYKINGEPNYTQPVSIPASVKQDTITGNASHGGFAYRNQYDFEIYIQDKLNKVAQTIKITSVPIFDWGKKDFNINGDLNVNGNITVNKTTIYDLMYPVGSIYMTTENINPETKFGIGTWEKIEGRMILGSQNGKYRVREQGGSEEHYHTTNPHAITIEEMPRHTHEDIVDSYNGMVYGLQGLDAYEGYGDCGLTINGGTTAKVGSTGGGKEHSHGDTNTINHMPPYYVAYIWHRIQ